MDNLLVGYNHYKRSDLLMLCRKYSKSIDMVYFAWPTMGSGRGCSTTILNRDDIELTAELLYDLSIISSLGIKLNLLVNSSCFGETSLSSELVNNIDEILQICNNHDAPIYAVTTVSYVLAQQLKNKHPQLHIKCSINNHSLSSVRQLDILKDFYDGFYYNRDYNYDFDTLKEISSWCRSHNKKLYLLVNSGCFTDCPVRQLHQNIAAHSAEVSKRQDNFTLNVAICGGYLQDAIHQKDYLSYSNVIRPEDVHIWKPYVDGIKLATRASQNIYKIGESYILEKYEGDLLNLLEPAHVFSFMPSIIDNTLIPDDYASKRIAQKCGHKCKQCGWCVSVCQNALRKIDEPEWMQTHENFLI